MNTNKVKLMTKIAIEDKKYSMYNNKVSGIGLGDYIFINLFSSFIAYSLCFLILALASGLLIFDKIVDILLSFNILDSLLLVIFTYLIGLVVYLLITAYIASKNYSIERKYIIRNNKRISFLKDKFYKEDWLWKTNYIH